MLNSLKNLAFISSWIIVNLKVNWGTIGIFIRLCYRTRKGTCLFSIAPPRPSPQDSTGTNKLLPGFPVWVLANFYCLRKAKKPGWYQIYGIQHGAVVLSGKRIWAPPGPLNTASPSCFSVMEVVSLPSWPLGASVPSFRQCFPLLLVLFPLLKSL